VGCRRGVIRAARVIITATVGIGRGHVLFGDAGYIARGD
jgi:hypothetical protein